LGEAAPNPENAIIEKVARLAKRYATGAPSDDELKALKVRLISQTSNWEKPASFRHENSSRPWSVASNQNPWLALQAHVGERATPTTKAGHRAKRSIPTVLTLALFMLFVGPVYLDETYAPLLPESAYRVAPETMVVPTNANGEPSASSGTARVAFRLGCEVEWNVIPPEQHCVSDPLWGRPEALLGDHRLSVDPAEAFSMLADQYLTSWARVRVSQNEAALQIRGSTAHETDREVPAAAPDKPKLSSLSASSRDTLSLTAPPSPPPVNDHSTVEQQHKASTKLTVEHLRSRANLTPLPQARPKTIDD
jgi:hypothetical protein